MNEEMRAPREDSIAPTREYKTSPEVFDQFGCANPISSLESIPSFTPSSVYPIGDESDPSTRPLPGEDLATREQWD